jgi:hypothetical protein
MREARTTLRLSDSEKYAIQNFAYAEGLTVSEAIRRLIFWNRLPGWTLPQPMSAKSQHAADH